MGSLSFSVEKLMRSGLGGGQRGSGGGVGRRGGGRNCDQDVNNNSSSSSNNEKCHIWGWRGGLRAPALTHAQPPFIKF